MQRGTNGFWRGVFWGLVVTIAAVLALAWSFPPLSAPEVDEGMQVPPAPPSAPPPSAARSGARSGAGTESGSMLTPAAGPLVEGVGAAPARPAPPAADAPAGSPSLVPAD